MSYLTSRTSNICTALSSLYKTKTHCYKNTTAKVWSTFRHKSGSEFLGLQQILILRLAWDSGTAHPATCSCQKAEWGLLNLNALHWTQMSNTVDEDGTSKWMGERRFIGIQFC